ncbi:hypothetical protein H0X10_03030 [Candidatus Saccharibacteria bacterium]|nr:hypothetical protein [Candidatus Saccharibacteria bacterium]
MHSEEKIRRLGVVFVILAVFVQMFASISKPESTLAESTNDIIRGGFTTRDQAVLHCLNGSSDFFEILTYYGLGCDSVANASTVEIRSNAADYDSLGRNQQGAIIARTGKPTNEYAVDIAGAGRFWMKDLRAWDSGAYSTYKVLKMTNKHGQTIMIMYNCGNIVTVGRYAPPVPPTPPPPAPVNRKPAMNFTANCTAVTWSAGDYEGMPRVRIYVTPATASPETDWNNKGTFVHSAAPTGSGTVNAGSWPVPSQYRNTTTRYRVFGVVSDRLPGGQMDDTNFVRAIPTTGILFGPCTQPTPPPPPPTTPEPPTDVCPYIPGTQTSEAECKPCEDSQTSEDGLSCLLLSKAARNVTQKIENADSTMANGGDVISYTLSVKNSGKITVREFVVEENIADILDYADVTDFNGGKLEGTIVRWPATTLSVNETIKRNLTVKIKNPIPSTPISSSDPDHFDLVMNNVYGNAINIELPGGVIKTTEIVTKSLPNTGPGESMAAAVALTVFVSYFFARSRLFAKELDIVRTDYATTGGY